MSTRGFTLIELMVSVSIFIFMTVLLVAKYGNFNQSVLLTNLAYDIALTLRTAQTYGLSVQGQTGQFQKAYGVAFCKTTGGNCVMGQNNQTMLLFSDTDDVDNTRKYVYGTADTVVNKYSLKRGAKIVGFCYSESLSSCSGPDTSANRLDISFLRPNPDALFARNGTYSRQTQYAKIFIEASDGSRRSIVVRKFGQISVEN